MLSFFTKPKATLKLTDKSFGNHEFILKENILQIGRNRSAFADKLITQKGSKINIAGNDITKRISIRHGTLSWDKINYKYTYKDESERGSIVDGDPLEHGEERILENGSELIIHPFKFTIHYP